MKKIIILLFSICLLALFTQLSLGSTITICSCPPGSTYTLMSGVCFQSPECSTGTVTTIPGLGASVANFCSGNNFCEYHPSTVFGSLVSQCSTVTPRSCSPGTCVMGTCQNLCNNICEPSDIPTNCPSDCGCGDCGKIDPSGASSCVEDPVKRAEHTPGNTPETGCHNYCFAENGKFWKREMIGGIWNNPAMGLTLCFTCEDDGWTSFINIASSMGLQSLAAFAGVTLINPC